VRADAVVGVIRMATGPEVTGPAPLAMQGTSNTCPDPGTVSRNGWSVKYETTATDGFRVYDVTYQGQSVVTSAKIAEWHADYGSPFYRDSTGCNPTRGPVYPYGDTLLRDLTGPSGAVIGFELVQDFRMENWNAYCRYRYQQHMQFFNDGRFRIVGGSFGKGCTNTAIYKALMRIDVSAGGQQANWFSVWNGSAWQTPLQESIWHQEAPYTPQGYKWRLVNAQGQGYYIEPGRGQFGDGGRGDFAVVFATRHNPAEGDFDLGPFIHPGGSGDTLGPEAFVNGESIDGENIVIWYVPQLLTEEDRTTGSYYCWTLQGEPDPVTYPCYAGPMFVPVPAGSEPPPTQSPPQTPSPTPPAGTPPPTASPGQPFDLYLPLIVRSD
jgi:hypothetical protein